MKSLKMGKVLPFRRKNTNGLGGTPDAPAGDGPEAVAARSVRAFCESSGPNNDEVLHLPPIVDAAESSPQAAAECAQIIRKYLKKDHWSKPSYQYNAIMLIRILSDNPGPTFTRNIDQKFTDTVKELLKSGRDPSVRQMLMETLDAFEHTKSYDEGLTLVIDMWKKEKEKAQRQYGGPLPPPPGPRPPNMAPLDAHSQNYFARSHDNPRLPDPGELASRLEEAKTSAKLLEQVVKNTPPSEVLENPLIKEFADRCTSASRSISMYMMAQDPAPDNDTMESLIDTNEQLQAALNLHQRAMLNSRKQLPTEDSASGLAVPVLEPNGSSSRRPSPNPASREPYESVYAQADAEPQPPRKTNGKGKGREYDHAVAGPSRSQSVTPAHEEDPFRDPQPETSGSSSYAGLGSSSAAAGSSATHYDHEPRLASEPFHPGFSATPSYLGRQESSVGKETMHGAVGEPSGSKTYNDDVDEDEDLYEAPPKNKEPMYRY